MHEGIAQQSTTSGLFHLTFFANICELERDKISSSLVYDLKKKKEIRHFHALVVQ